MSDKVFLDTNALIYFYSDTEPMKKIICAKAFVNYTCCTSIQALKELCNVFIKKFKYEQKLISRIVDKICAKFEVHSISDETIKEGLRLNERYKYSFYDCLMLASAIEAGCGKIFSEDMQDGQVIEDGLVIENIFIPC